MITRSRLQFFSLCLLTALTQQIQADVPHLDVIGFSPDGRYFAFEQYGFNEGEGLPYSHMYFIDVERNDYVTKPIIYEAPADEPTAADPKLAAPPKADIDTLQARARNRNRIFAQNIFEDLKLHYPLPGERVIHHPMSDLGVKTNHVSFTPDMPLGGLSYDKYELNLSVLRTKLDEDNPSCNGMGSPKMFKLTLSYNEGQTQVLQEDKRLPPTRGCPLNYRIQDVYMYEYEKKQYIAILLNVISAGFEGQDMRYLAVTALIKPAKVNANPKISMPPRPKADKIDANNGDKADNKSEATDKK